MPVEEPGGGLPRCPVLPGPTRSVKPTATVSCFVSRFQHLSLAEPLRSLG